MLGLSLHLKCEKKRGSAQQKQANSMNRHTKNFQSNTHTRHDSELNTRQTLVLIEQLMTIHNPAIKRSKANVTILQWQFPFCWIARLFELFSLSFSLFLDFFVALLQRFSYVKSNCVCTHSRKSIPTLFLFHKHKDLTKCKVRFESNRFFFLLSNDNFKQIRDNNLQLQQIRVTLTILFIIEFDVKML